MHINCILSASVNQILFPIFLFAVEELEQEIKELGEEIEKLKTQKPKMTVGDILNDTEKVMFLVNIICKPSYIFTTSFIHNLHQFKI